jgi:hypothetical protein
MAESLQSLMVMVQASSRAQISDRDPRLLGCLEMG